MANCIKIARRKLCQSMIAKSRIIRKKGRIIIPKPSKIKSRIIRKKVGLSSQNHQKWSPNLPKMTQKSMPKLGSWKSRNKWRLGFLPVNSFWSKIRPKSSKLRFVQDFWHPKRHPKIDAEKVWKKYARRFPKWDQNGCQNHYCFILFQKRRKRSKLFVLQYKTWFLLTKNNEKSMICPF